MYMYTSISMHIYIYVILYARAVAKAPVGLVPRATTRLGLANSGEGGSPLTLTLTVSWWLGLANARRYTEPSRAICICTYIQTFISR